MQPEDPGEGSAPVQTDPAGRHPWPAEPGAAEPPEPTPQAGRSRLRSGLTVAAVLLGLAGLAASAVGIAGQANCAAGADPAAAPVLGRHGCAAMLRATYIDATGSLVVTIGVAVMPDAAATAASIRALPSRHGVRSGVRPLAFGNTLTAGFGSPQRQLSYAVAAGPYLILSVAGYADGRPRVLVSSDAYAQDEMASLANGVADAVRALLGALPSPPTCPGAPGC